MTVAFHTEISIGEIMDSLPKAETAHMLRVGVLADILTQKLLSMGMTRADRAEALYFGAAAAYHDIGKAWVPPGILNKPEKLTPEEWALVSLHPLHAKRLFYRLSRGSVTDMPALLVCTACHTAVYHHERWDGGGYPYGIGYESIPLSARVTSICDAYDAMTSPRPYHRAVTHQDACLELSCNAGSQFDPVLVRAFLSIEHDIAAAADKRPERICL